MAPSPSPSCLRWCVLVLFIRSCFRCAPIIVVLFQLCHLCHSGWVDPDTARKHHSTISLVDTDPQRQRQFQLVFSDEFNLPGRRFHDGEDPRWTAIHKNDYTNFALHYYNADLITTDSRGYLNISTIIEDISFEVKQTNPVDGSESTTKMTKNYQSGMLQGWNKFCFTGGIVELSAQLPGKWDIGGMWPAIWLLGNLARATFVGTSNNVWPWSFDTCSSDLQSQQRISQCNVVNHYGLNAKQGRGAPEIDIFEAMSGNEKLIHTPIHRPYLSTSYQVAPARSNYRPMAAQPPDAPELWYNHGLEYQGNTSLNIFFYGMNLEGAFKDQSYIADAISANSNLDASFFEGFHKYRLEWQPSRPKPGGEEGEVEDGYIKWFIDDELRFGISASALNDTGAMIPQEPMYLIINNAISSTWGFPMPCPEGCPCDCFDCRKDECLCAVPPRMIESFPTSFLVDYIRVYQSADDASHSVGCSTKEHPTRQYIAAHPKLYEGPLLPVAQGGSRCDQDGQCGQGHCDEGKCSCRDGFTGPQCSAPTGFNDVDLDPLDGDLELFLMSLFVSPTLVVSVAAAFVALAAVGVYSYKYNRSMRGGAWSMLDQRLGAYQAIPDDSMARADLELIERQAEPRR